MMKKLILVRHAKSDRSIAGQKDFDRSLSEQGHREAPKMAYKFAEMNVNVDLVVSSKAERARLTAEYFAEQFKYENDKIVWNENIYESSARVLMNEVNQFDDKYDTIMLVGHNPGMSFFAEYLTKSLIGDMPTCAVVAISFEIDSWKIVTEGLGKLDFYIFPPQES